MSEYLPFWPKAAVAAYAANDGDTASIFSRALPTNGFTEVVIQLEVDAEFGTTTDTKIKAVPQISNDGVNWKELTSATEIAAMGTFPKQYTEKFTEIGAFMRIKILITSHDAAAVHFAATVMVAGAGRS